MATVQSAVSDMLVTVKSRVIQRAMSAEYRGDAESARKHYLAAAHLELLLADDYAHAGEPRLAFRSRLSAASCFWTGGDVDRGREIFAALRKKYPARYAEINDAQKDLERSYAQRPRRRQTGAKRVEKFGSKRRAKHKT